MGDFPESGGHEPAEKGSKKARKFHLGDIFYLISRIMRWIFVAIIAGIVIMVAVFLYNLHNAGWSLTAKDTVVQVDNADFHRGMMLFGEFDYAGAEQALLLAREKLSADIKKNGLQVAEVEQKLGFLYLELDRFPEAYEMLNSSYTRFNRILGARDNKTVLASAQISIYYMKMGDFERAQQGLDKIWDDSKTARQKLQIGQLLAQVYMQNEEYERAYSMYTALINIYEMSQQVLDVIDENFGDGDNPTVIYWSGYLYLYNDLGVLYATVGAFEWAINFYNFALSVMQEYSIGRDADEALLYSNLADAYAGWGKHEKAEEYNQKALELYRRISGDRSLDIAIIYAQMSNRYRVMQMHEQWFDYLSKAIELTTAAVGEQHYLTASFYSDLSRYYTYVGDNSKAIEYGQKAIQIRKDILGRYHTSTAFLYSTLANILYSADKHDEAVEAANEAVEIYEHIFGTENVRTAYAYCVAAWSYDASGQQRLALGYSRRAVEIIENYGSAASRIDMAYAYETLAHTLAPDDVDYDKVEEYYLKAIELYKSVLPEEHTTLANAYHRLGSHYLDIMQYEQALGAYLQTKAIYEKLHPNDFGFLEIVYQSIGMAKYRLLQYDEALSYYGNSREIRQRRIEAEKNLPNINIDVQYLALAVNFNNTAAVYEDMGEYETAAKYQLTAYHILVKIGIDPSSEQKIWDRLNRLHIALEPEISLDEWLAASEAEILY